MQYSSTDIEFRELFARNADLGLIEAQETELKRLLSNLITNAVESIEKPRGVVEVSTSISNSGVEIRIRDTGRGVDSIHLESLGQQGFSFGKADGTGLGLFHAIETMRYWNGTLSIDSKVGTGTSVVLTFERFHL